MPKKFLDQNGLEYFARKFNDYPDNELLGTVITAIGEELDEKSDVGHTHTAAEVGALPNTTVIPTSTSDLINDSGYLTSYTETDPVFTASAAAGISSSDISNWNDKSNLWKVSGSYNDDYEWWNLELNHSALWRLNNAPGSNATVYDIKIPTGSSTYLTLRNPYYEQYKNKVLTFPSATGTLALTSDIPSVPSWALEPTKPVYTASEVGATTTADVNSLISTAIGEINSFEVSIVQSLPTEDIDTHTIYFISNNGTNQNIYDEYMYINNNWEKIGTTNIDLSNYVQANRSDHSSASSSVINGVGTVDISAITSRINQSRIYLDGSTLNLKSWTGASNENNANAIVLTPTTTTINNIVTPTSDAMAANKKYVDDAVAVIPTKISDLTNDVGYITSYTETDPTVPAWAKAATKPNYTASEVGALPSSTTYVSSFNGSTGDIIYTAPVTSVNGQTGAVTLTIPAAQVQSDWNATSGMGVILNKPTIPAATTVTQTLTSGTAIGAVNGTTLYAPTPYNDTALAARVTALENIPWVTYYTGTSEPSNSQGQNGDIYLQTE